MEGDHVKIKQESGYNDKGPFRITTIIEQYEYKEMKVFEKPAGCYACPNGFIKEENDNRPLVEKMETQSSDCKLEKISYNPFSCMGMIINAVKRYFKSGNAEKGIITNFNFDNNNDLDLSHLKNMNQNYLANSKTKEIFENAVSDKTFAPIDFNDERKYGGERSGFNHEYHRY